MIGGRKPVFSDYALEGSIVMARATKQDVWEARFHRMRRETWWGVVLGLCAVAYAAYSIKQEIINPGWDFEQPMWGNRFAIGFAWGTVGVTIPIAIALLFWSGAAAKLIKDFRGFGWGLVLAFIAVICLGAYIWGYYTSKVVKDEVQQEGWGLGLFTSVVAVSAAKTIFLGITGHPMWKVHGRVKSKKFVRRATTPYSTSEEHLDEHEIDDRDNLRIVSGNPRRQP